MSPRTIEPEFLTVTPIRYKEEDGGGTGFFLNHNGRTYLITNRHVVNPEDDDVNPTAAYVWFRNTNNVGKANRNAIRLVRDGNPRWRGHPNNPDDVDLVAIPLHPQLSSLDDLFSEQKTINSGSLAFTPDYFIHGNVQVDQRVSIVGYPGDFMDRSTRLPVRRNALIASPYGYAFENRPFFLTDARMHPGTSGSPVLMSPRGMQLTRGDVPDHRSKQLYLLGVHSATFDGTRFEEHEMGEDEETEENTPESKLDLNVAWYPELIKEILEE